jgi:nicotinamidase-related amidase
MSWREDAAALPALAPPPVELSVSATALVVIDLQYVDAHREYALGAKLKQSHPGVWDYYFTRVEDVVLPHTGRLLEAFRGKGMRVIHFTVGPELPDGSDLLPARRAEGNEAMAAQAFHKGSFEHQLLPEVAPIAGELIINKTSRGAFNSTGFDHTLRNMGITTIVFAGVMTSSCIETTARDAVDRGYSAIVVEDATAELDQASHEATLKQHAARWGRVWTTGETIAAVAALPGGDAG